MIRKVLIFLSVVAVVAADVATITSCEQAKPANQTEQTDQVQDTPPTCTVDEVRITPCHNKNEKCKLRRGTEAQISMDFTTNFTATRLKTEVYNIGLSRIKWGDLNDDACLHTTCPSDAGNQQQFNYGLQIGKKLPKGIFIIDWQVFDEANKNNMCCFRTKLHLI